MPGINWTTANKDNVTLVIAGIGAIPLKKVSHNPANGQIMLDYDAGSPPNLTSANNGTCFLMAAQDGANALLNTGGVAVAVGTILHVWENNIPVPPVTILAPTLTYVSGLPAATITVAGPLPAGPIVVTAQDDPTNP